MSRTKTENEAPAHKYFTQMLNIAEDELDPFQYRLLAHYVRWTGHGGESDESIRAAAKATKMGVNKIRSTLDELVVLKYITVDRPTPQEARNGKTIHITIIDRWMDNIIKYQGVSKTIQGSAKPVSKKIHTPVSKKIRLEEQGKEEQEEEPNTLASSDATPKPTAKRYYFEAVALGVFEVSDFKGLSPASLKRIGLLEKSAKSAIKAHYPDIGDEQGALLISKYCAAEKFKPNLQGQTKFELGLTAFLEKNGAHIPSFLANQTPPPVTSAEPAEYVDPDMVKAAMLAIQEKWNANDKRVAS